MLLKPEEFSQELQKGAVGPLYCLYGEEPYLVERAVKRLLDLALPPEGRDFNLALFYGKECKGEEVADAVQTFPMFADRRVVVVKRCNELTAAAQEALLTVVQNPVATSCLILQGEKIDQRTKFFGEFKKNGVLVEFKRPYENQLGPIVRDELSSHGKRIEPAAADLLVGYVGSNLQELASQVEKVATFVADRPTVTVADVRAIVSDTKVDSVFELCNSFGNRDLAGAMRRLHTILRDGEAPLMLLNMLTRHLRQLWQIRECLDQRLSSAEIEKRLGIRSFFLKGLLTQAKNFDGERYRQMFERLFELDLAMKSSGGEPALLLEFFLLEYCRER